MQTLFSWYLILPVACSLLYGWADRQAVAKLGFPAQQPRGLWIAATGISAAFSLIWSAVGFPLPLFFLLAYLVQMGRLAGKGPVRLQNWFLFHVNYVNMLALHSILIGAGALIQGVALRTVLADPFWRAMSLSAVLTAAFAGNLVFLHLPKLSALIDAEAESEEAHSFMAFLCLCTGYLLVDSLLCVAAPEPLYPPLFLMVSSVALILFLLRCLLHIDAILRAEHLRAEHDALTARLEAKQISASTLRRLADRDTLTGAWSRRYAMERIHTLMEAGTPFSLAFLDLDGLKQRNDQDGHDAGDRYLRSFSQALEARLRESDLLARVGGDEFVVLIPGCGKAKAARRMEIIRRTLTTAAAEQTFHFSFGVSAFPQEAKRDPQKLLREADLAMYQDKVQRRREETDP